MPPTNPSRGFGFAPLGLRSLGNRCKKSPAAEAAGQSSLHTVKAPGRVAAIKPKYLTCQ
jgi:hypothetical protein